MKYPIVFWAYSPITYEAYLSFKSQQKKLGLDIYLILTRIRSDEEALVHTKDKGLYWDQNTESQEKTWHELKLGLEEIIAKHGGYTLCVPQSGIPYIEVLIESHFCKGYAYIEDGTLNYDRTQTFENFTSRLCYRYNMNIGPNMAAIADLLQVSTQEIASRHLRGVPLLDFQHRKYLGSFKFFDEAFPRAFSTKIMICEDPTMQLNDNGLIIVPNFKLLKSEDSLQDYLISLKNIIKAYDRIEWIVKVHPNQSAIEEEQISKILEIKAFNEWSQDKPFICNREQSFLSYDTFVVPSNSTLHYIKKANLKNYIVVNFPNT